MDNREILLQEYNNLWNEKLIHKQSIRKFHNYLTYVTAIGSLALAFHGLSIQDIYNVGLDPTKAEQLRQNASTIINLFFMAFAPVVIVTVTFPLNDIYHIFVMGHQIGGLEKRVNQQSGVSTLLSWEHVICPVVYGEKKIEVGSSQIKLTNIISFGDKWLLVPAVLCLCIFAVVMSVNYIYKIRGCVLAVGYFLIIVYMATVIVSLLWKINRYTHAGGPIANIVESIQKTSDADGPH